jgi:uncharacterized protein
MRVSGHDETAAALQDRKALWLFLVLVVVLSLALDVPMAQAGSIAIWNGWAVFLLMWVPGVSAIITSLSVYRSLAPLGLLGNRRVFFWVVLCAVIPVLYTLVIYPSLQGLGLLTVSMVSFGVLPLAGALWLSAKSAFGEELGWRGFAAPVFSRVFGFRRGQLYLGLVWFIYHLPPLLFTSYGASPHVVFGNLMFLVVMVFLSYFLGWARQQSNSVWPSTVYHASHNVFFLHLFAMRGQDEGAAGYLVGEQGMAVALVATALGVIALWRAGSSR